MQSRTLTYTEVYDKLKIESKLLSPYQSTYPEFIWATTSYSDTEDFIDTLVNIVSKCPEGPLFLELDKWQNLLEWEEVHQEQEKHSNEDTNEN